MNVDAFTIVAGVTGSCGAALLGWAIGARSARRKPNRRFSRRGRIALVTFVAVAASVAAIFAPIVGVFWVIFALNLLLGRRENVPFSTYAMFSMPPTRAWTLRFEDPDGEVIRVGEIGLAPHIMRKRFETELQTARSRGALSAAEARRRAGQVIATLVEQRRPPGGPLAALPITIVLVDYTLEQGHVVTVRTPIVETAPE